MTGTCKLHGPASHWVLALLPDASICGRQHTNAKKALILAWCPAHVVYRTRSAHAGAPSGMLFNDQKGQEFIFCMVAAPRSCHSRLTSKGCTYSRGEDWDQEQVCAPFSWPPLPSTITHPDRASAAHHVPACQQSPPFPASFSCWLNLSTTLQETRGDHGTGTNVHLYQCRPLLGHEANFMHPSRAHACSPSQMTTATVDHPLTCSTPQSAAETGTVLSAHRARGCAQREAAKNASRQHV